MKPAGISTAFPHLDCTARTRRIHVCAVHRTENLTTPWTAKPATSAFFRAPLAGSLAVAFLVTTPVNRAMIRRGQGHGVLHNYYQAAP